MISRYWARNLRHEMIRALRLLFFLALALPSFAAVPKTTIVGTLLNYGGSHPINCTVTVKNSAPFSVDDTVTGATNKHHIGLFEQTFNVSNGNSVFIQLVPNTGSGNAPDATFYSVSVKSSIGSFTQSWQVPTSGTPVLLANVVVASPSPTTNNYVSVNGGAFSGLVTFNAGHRLLPGSAPSGVEGQFYFDSTSHQPFYHNGTSFVSLGNALSEVIHDATLTGTGTGGSPLGVVTSALTHNNLGGLTTGDPHTQYVLAAGTRAFSGNQSFGGFQATNVRLENLATGSLPAAGAGTKGRVVFDSTANLFYYDNGTALINPLSRSNHSGTQTRSTISDFSHASTHNGGGSDPLDGFFLLLTGGTMSGSLGMGGNTITNFRVDPQASDPAATAGRVWFNTSSNRLKWGNGTVVIDPLDRANHSGTHAADVNFGNFQALSFRVENVAVNPAAGQAGRLLYNTATQKLQLDTGSSVGDIGVSASVVTASPITGNGLAGSPVDLDEAAVTHNNLGGLTAGDPHTQYINKDGSRALTANWGVGGFELQNFVVENVATGSLAAPGAGNEGRLSFDDTAKELTFSDGTNRIRMSATATARGIPVADGSNKIAIGYIPTGSTAATVCIGNDARLSDSRTPTTHAGSHAPGGGDPIDATYLPKAGGTMSGNLNFGNFQGLSMRLENLATNPAAGNAGRTIFNTTLGKIQIDNGSTFGDLLGASSIVWAQAGVTQGAGGTADLYGMSVAVAGGTATIRPTGDIGPTSQKFLNCTDSTTKTVAVVDSDGFSTRSSANVEGERTRTLHVTTVNTDTPTEATDGAGGYITLASGDFTSFEARLTLKATAGTNASKGAVYVFKGLLKNVGGTSSLVGTVQKETIAEEVEGWDGAVTADDTNDRIVMKHTGDSGSTVAAVWSVRTTVIN